MDSSSINRGFNGDIVSMDPSAEVRRANIETGLTMTLLELGGAVDLFNANESDPANSPLRVQMLGGVRYYAVDAAAIVSLPNINPLIQIENGANWVDLFVGSQALASITPNNFDSCVKFHELAKGQGRKVAMHLSVASPEIFIGGRV